MSWATQDCINGMLKKKTVVLVTHQIDFLHEADSILVRAMIIFYGNAFNDWDLGLQFSV